MFSTKMSSFPTTFSNILGMGIDMVDVRRIKGVLMRHHDAFIRRIFTDQEQAQAEHKKQPYLFYAKRFAAKEAFAKATGLGIGSIVGWRDVEMVSLGTGQPTLVLSKTCAQALKARWNQSFDTMVSISDEFPYAQALVLIVGTLAHPVVPFLDHTL